MFKRRGRSLRRVSKSSSKDDSPRFVIEVLENRLLLSSSQLVFIIQPPPTAVAGAAFSAIVEIEDTNGDVVTSDTSAVTLSISGPTGGTFSGTLVATAQNGVASFAGLSETMTGNYSLTASDTSDGATSAPSSSLTITPAAATQLSILQEPANATSGVPISPPVEVGVEDIYNNIVTTDTSSVTIAIAGQIPIAPLVTFSGNSTTVVAAINGIATFSNLTFVADGRFTVTLEALDGSLTSASTGPVFQIGYPALLNNPIPAGKLPPILLSLEDSSNTVQTLDNTSTLTLSLGSGPGTLSGTLTATTINGIATFSDLNIATAGTYTFDATDSGDGIAKDLSSAFEITPGLVFHYSPSTGQVGSIFPVVVDVVNAGGNSIASDSSSTVTLSIASGPTDSFAGGATTETAAVVNGVAVFTGMAMSQIGTYTFTATDAAEQITGSPASSPLVISNTPTKLVIPGGTEEVDTITVNGSVNFGEIFSISAGDQTITFDDTETSDASGVLSALASDWNADARATLIATATVNGNELVLTAADQDVPANIVVSSSLIDTITKLPVNFAASGASLNLAVDVENSANGIVTTDNSTVTLSLMGAPSGDSLTGTLTAVDINGVATFGSAYASLSIGTYTLEATDGSLAPAMTNLVITAGPPTHLAFTVAPSSATAGQAMTFVVEEEDAGGNLVIAPQAITLWLFTAPPGSAFSPQTTITANGMATFSDAVVTRLGVYVFRASDMHDGFSANTGQITVGSTSASKLAMQNLTRGAGLSLNLLVDVDNSGNGIVTTDSSTITLALIGAPASDGSLVGTLTAVAINGIATFASVAADMKIGTYTIRATDGSLTSATAELIVTAGQATTLVFKNLPATITAGTSFKPIVELEDAFGNPVPSTSPIGLFVVSPSGFTIPGSTEVLPVNGFSTFGSILFTRVGKYIFSAAIGNNSAPKITSGPLTVNNGALSKTVFITEPANMAQGSMPTIVVELEDAYNNICTIGVAKSDPVTITIDSEPSGATLGGTKVVAANNGVASFSNLVLTTQGTYNLQATAGGKSGTSTHFSVQTDVPSKLVFISEPNSRAYADSTLGNVIVAIENSLGEVIRGNSSTVTLAASPVGSSPTAKLLGTTSIKTINGEATFTNLSLKTAGSYDLTATDSTLPGNTAHSTQFDTSFQLAFQSIGAVSHNDVIKVAVENGLGAVETADNLSTITLALNTSPAGAVLKGTTTAKVVNGLATFTVSELHSNGTTDFGTYTFRATSADSAISSTTGGTKFVSGPVVIST